MIEIKKEGILLEKTALGFESDGVLNPAAIKEGDTVHIFFRAVAKGNYSTIGYCRLKGPLLVEERLDVPLLFPQFDFESHGVEDPRIVKIDGLYYLTYTAYDGINAMGALAVSKDLVHFEKLGIIVPRFTYEEFSRLTQTKGAMPDKYQRYNGVGHIPDKMNTKAFVWDKNVIFFPERINGMLYFLHRIKPDIQIAAVNKLEDLTTEFWQNYCQRFDENIVLSAKHKHEVSYIGGGCPPVKTEHGWLVIYHSVHDTLRGYVYCACAALLDLDNPGKEIARLPYPLFKPDEDWELNGVVNNVCFPTGTALFDDTLYIYYGAADEKIGSVSVSLTALVAELLFNSYIK